MSTLLPALSSPSTNWNSGAKYAATSGGFGFMELLTFERHSPIGYAKYLRRNGHTAA